jgi:hypothetical protein
LFGGPGTTQLLSNYSTPAVKKANSPLLSPYPGSIDPASSTGLIKYNNFVKSPYNKRIDCSIGNRNLILAALSKKAEQYSFAILRFLLPELDDWRELPSPSITSAWQMLT